VIRRSKDLVPALVYLAVREVLSRGGDEEADEAAERELAPAAGSPST